MASAADVARELDQPDAERANTMQSWVEKMFTGCRLAGHNGNPEGIRNEESMYSPDIFLCDSPRLSWPEFWTKFQSFG